jgi:hypothetical protein
MEAKMRRITAALVLLSISFIQSQCARTIPPSSAPPLSDFSLGHGCKSPADHVVCIGPIIGAGMTEKEMGVLCE